ncbi:MAG TPA: TetR/AcrR family transcriptional regulator [Polyangia bacterium]|jgi:AcrR family transcriptional regulator
MSTAAAKKLAGSARDRLLAAANELFYEEGVHTVGIERVIERAGVAKASLYSTFGSKDELVHAYLQARADRRRRRISERIARHPDARSRILAIFDLMGELAADPAFRGCAFYNASAEGPRKESKASRVCDDQRSWTAALFTELARDAGVAQPARLGRQLVLLYDGAMVGASMDRSPDAPAVAREMAEVLLDAEAPARGGKRRAPKT